MSTVVAMPWIRQAVAVCQGQRGGASLHYRHLEGDLMELVGDCADLHDPIALPEGCCCGREGCDGTGPWPAESA